MRTGNNVISTTYAERLAPKVLIGNGEESVLWGQCGVEIRPHLRGELREGVPATLQRVPTFSYRFVAPYSTIDLKSSSASGYPSSDHRLTHHRDRPQL